jgi:hypothetical protein
MPLKNSKDFDITCLQPIGLEVWRLPDLVLSSSKLERSLGRSNVVVFRLRLKTTGNECDEATSV